MRVSQRLDYTLRMLIALARTPVGATITSGDIAARLGLPRRFGEQQMTALSKTGLVASRRGTGGGISLGRPAAEITVLDIVQAVQGDALDVPHVSSSVTTELWSDAAQALETFLSSTTLAELAKRQAKLEAAAGPMYYI
jgi:Rrf2 family protein